MDLIYIVGADLKHNHLELKYSIRSMQKHLDSIGKLFIVGEYPSFLNGAIHIPATDPHRHNDARNIYEKILLACNDRRVGKKSLYCSDDYFLNRNFNSSEFPYFYEGDIITVNNRVSATGTYKPYVQATLTALQQRNLPVKYFNVHSPIIYDKALFKKLMPDFDWSGKFGFIAKSLYGNAAGIEGVPVMDCKIRTPKTKTAIARYINDVPFFSTNHHAINKEMIETLEELYPVKSKWEI